MLSVLSPGVAFPEALQLLSLLPAAPGRSHAAQWLGQLLASCFAIAEEQPSAKHGDLLGGAKRGLLTVNVVRIAGGSLQGEAVG